MAKKANKHLGSSLNDLLANEGLLEEAEAVAIKRVIAYEVAREMAHRGLSKAAMAQLMETSRSALDRLLDPENTSVTLNTMQRAAHAIGKRLKLSLA